LITGLVCFGFEPILVTELTGSRWRLQRLVDLISRCEFSFHDLSYVNLDGPRRVPRFNIPFELGLAIGLHPKLQHQIYVFEAKQHRLQHSLSDANGLDPLIHNRTATGVLRALANGLSRLDRPPTMELLRRVHSKTRQLYHGLKDEYGWVFEPACFREVAYGAGLFLQEEISKIA